MTAKEAIKNIKGLLDGCCGPELDDTREAFDLAIKALEAQDGTDTNVGSTISRQAAINAVEHITSSMSVCVTTDECHGMKRMQRQAVIELANLPSAQPMYESGLRERLADDSGSYDSLIPCEYTTADTTDRQVAGKLKNPAESLLSGQEDVTKEQPCKLEPCEDAVSREDVINFLCDWICAPGERCVSTCKCLKGIRELPPVKLKDALDDAYAHGYTDAEAKFYQWREEHECEDAVSRAERRTDG